MDTRFQILAALVYSFVGTLSLLLILVISPYVIILGAIAVFLLSWSLARKYAVHRSAWDICLVAPGLIIIAYVLLVRYSSCAFVATRFLAPFLLVLYMASFLGGRLGIVKPGKDERVEGKDSINL